ncbi:hypothetical protein MMC11_004737 [Xylographa trunciseda]|nr:hypothetical protein [Xylographa trunciseda]
MQTKLFLAGALCSAITAVSGASVNIATVTANPSQESHIESDAASYFSSLFAQPQFTSVVSVMYTGVPQDAFDSFTADPSDFFIMLATETAAPAYIQALPTDVQSYLSSVGAAEASIIVKDTSDAKSTNVGMKVAGALMVAGALCVALLEAGFLSLSLTLRHGSRKFSRTSTANDKSSSTESAAQDANTQLQETKQEQGAMSRRLEDMTEQTVEEGGRRAQKYVEEAGFSEELKRKLEARIADSNFKSANPAAFAQIDMPSSAGQGTRDIAAAQPWTGSEKLEDAALRMLNDAHKPLRHARSPKILAPRGTPANVDLRMRKAVEKSRGERLANARDKTSIYSLSQDASMTEKEREQLRKQLKERFTSGARPMPTSVQGLAALANERIEDAIPRGQFKNIPRGKGKNIERDYTASSPFLDTTEYFMNKIIQKQDIVPPWIEKQQELVKAASVFRSRLRADWKRHAARVISSKGGPLDTQIRRAEAYAAAEAANNPKAAKFESFSEIDSQGKLAQITVTEIPVAVDAAEDSKITITESEPGESIKTPPGESSTNSPDTSGTLSDPRPASNGEASVQIVPPLSAFPFRDPDWEKLELPYHTLALSNLNNLTRSYNLMAPDLAKKPYFSLQRELRSCFADVAAQLPAEIKQRAMTPAKIRVEVIGHRPGGILDKFGGEQARVWDTTRPNYGFKEFWKNLWGGDKDRAI